MDLSGESSLTEKQEVRLTHRDNELLTKFATDNRCSKSDVLRKALAILLANHSYLTDEEKKALGINGEAKKEGA